MSRKEYNRGYANNINIYEKNIGIFTRDLLQSAYNLVFTARNGYLFNDLVPKNKRRGVEIIYRTWLRYGVKICKKFVDYSLKAIEEIKEHNSEYQKTIMWAQRTIKRNLEIVDVFDYIKRRVVDNARALSAGIIFTKSSLSDKIKLLKDLETTINYAYPEKPKKKRKIPG